MPTLTLPTIAAWLATMFLFLGATQNVAAQPPTWGQCSCPVTTEPDAGDANYSIITNATLCINASGSSPICRIEVRCLQDGSGPNCQDSAKSTWSEVNLHSAIDSLTMSTFESEPKLIKSLTKIYSVAFKDNAWKGLAECLETYQLNAAAAPAERPINTWRQDGHGLACVYTRSGWLHVVLDRTDHKPIYRTVIAVSYQFSPPRP